MNPQPLLRGAEMVEALCRGSPSRAQLIASRFDKP